MIKNYGSSRIFPLPSYISTANFSTILIAVLKEDFDNKIDAIAQYKRQQSALDLEVIRKELLLANDIDKIKELLAYYEFVYAGTETTAGLLIDKDTSRILAIHLKDSIYNMDAFTKKTGEWFDDSMNRVSGWYKRQVQVLLFLIGLGIAIVFNVDTIQIADKLTTDKDARAKIVELAIKASDQYKDDPRIKNLKTSADSARADSLMQLSDHHLKEARKTLDSGIANANDLLAIGWDGYGRHDSSFLEILHSKIWIGPFYFVDSAAIMDMVIREWKQDSIKAAKKKSVILTAMDSIQPVKKDTGKLKTKTALVKIDTIKTKQPAALKLPSSFDTLQAFYNYQYKHYPVHVKTAYVWYELKRERKKKLGFLITAFAICLGAPFWFDLMNKLVKLRAAGKKEDTGTGNLATAKQQAVNINVNTQKSGEEAVG